MLKRLEIVTKSAVETKKMAAVLGVELKSERNKNIALIIALEGNLGSGKTTFIQGLAEGMAVQENVLSPTFLILKQFPLALGHYKNLYHIDAYRLKNPEEMIELGFEDLINDPENIIVIEWADKMQKILPRGIIRIRFDNLGGNKRKITISN